MKKHPHLLVDNSIDFFEFKSKFVELFNDRTYMKLLGKENLLMTLINETLKKIQDKSLFRHDIDKLILHYMLFGIDTSLEIHYLTLHFDKFNLMINNLKSYETISYINDKLKFFDSGSQSILDQPNKMIEFYNKHVIDKLNNQLS